MKWAGGKRWLIHKYRHLFNVEHHRYIEPFLGAGSIFFRIRSPYSVISDLNYDLINVYKTIRDDPHAFIDLLTQHSKRHCNDYYYAQRAAFRKGGAEERAARFVYINRTCWNGLYRVNLKGEFNVPIGTKAWVVSAHDDFLGISQRLSACEILCCDFETPISMSKSGDLLFLDPPYTATESDGTFIKYNNKVFTWNDQLRLFNATKSAADRGVKFVLTNGFNETLAGLYKTIGYVHEASRPIVLSGKKEARGTYKELIVTNIQGITPNE